VHFVQKTCDEILLKVLSSELRMPGPRCNRDYRRGAMEGDWINRTQPRSVQCIGDSTAVHVQKQNEKCFRMRHLQFDSTHVRMQRKARRRDAPQALNCRLFKFRDTGTLITTFNQEASHTSLNDFSVKLSAEQPYMTRNRLVSNYYTDTLLHTTQPDGTQDNAIPHAVTSAQAQPQQPGEATAIFATHCGSAGSCSCCHPLTPDYSTSKILLEHDPSSAKLASRPAACKRALGS
jgi:hypothetical protein